MEEVKNIQTPEVNETGKTLKDLRKTYTALYHKVRYYRLKGLTEEELKPMVDEMTAVRAQINELKK